MLGSERARLPVCLLAETSACLHFFGPRACPSITSICFSLSTTYSNANWQDMPRNISLSADIPFTNVTISLSWRIISWIKYCSSLQPLHVLFLGTIFMSSLVAYIYISLSHAMTKHPTHSIWNNACISISLQLVWQEHLSECRQAALYICISDRLSSVCFPLLVFSTGSPASMFPRDFPPSSMFACPTLHLSAHLFV